MASIVADSLTQTERNEQVHLPFTPMPVHVFNEAIDSTSYKQVSTTIQKTKEAADTFYNAFYRKTLKDASTESESIEEIYREIMTEMMVQTKKVKQL